MSRGRKQEESLVGDGHGQITGRHINRLNYQIRHAQTTGEPLQLYIGSCPDYTHDGETYTFQGVNDGVPLLTVKQVAANQALFDALERLWRTILLPHYAGRY